MATAAAAVAWGATSGPRNLVCISDSMLEYNSTEQYLAELTGSDVRCIGFGGTSYARRGDAWYDAYAMASLADCIAMGDWSEQESRAPAMSRFGDNSKQRYVEMARNLDWSVTRTLLLLFGTNDFAWSVRMGADDSLSRDTFAGAINHTIQRLSTAIGRTQIVLATPIWRARQAMGDGKNSDTHGNDIGLKLSDYADTIQRLGTRHNLPVVDLYRSSGVNAKTHEIMLADGLHLADLGQRAVAREIAGAVRPWF